MLFAHRHNFIARRAVFRARRVAGYGGFHLRKIAIIGANESINKLIIKAKELDCETHVFAWQCGDPGEASADFFYPISIDKKEEILEKCGEIGIDGVVSVTSDFAVNTVNYVARKLGLTGNGEKTDKYARNKYLMRCAFRDAGLYTPWFVKADCQFAIEDAKDFSYPVIVKPTDRWSSKGVTRVDSEDGLMAAVSYARGESLEGAAIIEGFMQGEEYSCECLCIGGEYHALQMTKKITTGFPHYVEAGHIQPCGLSDAEKQRAEAVIFKALEALQIREGAAHAEFRVLPDGNIGIIEIGARMGGDCIGTDLVMLSTGYDYLKMVIEIACGEKPALVREPHYSEAEVSFIINRSDMDAYYHARKDGLIIAEYGISGEFDGEVLDSSGRHGYYITVR